MQNTIQPPALSRRKQVIVFLEHFSWFALIAIGLAWLLGVRPPPPPAARSYHFRGEFCGVELWEYSAEGNEMAIWAEWTTNFGNSGPPHVLVVRTGTVAQFVTKP